MTRAPGSWNLIQPAEYRGHNEPRAVNGEMIFVRIEWCAAINIAARPRVAEDVFGIDEGGAEFNGHSSKMREYVGKVLHGSPSELPLQRPERFDLVINLKTATAIGVDLPARLQLLADEVIE